MSSGNCTHREFSTAHTRRRLRAAARELVRRKAVPLPLRQPQACAPCRPSCRYSTIRVARCDAAGGLVAIKCYDQPTLSSKKQRMATREAIVWRYLHQEG